MQRWCWRISLVLCSTALFVGTIGYCAFTLPWEETWINGANALTLRQPDETLSGKELELFLAEFSVDNRRQFGLQCEMNRRTGTVVIAGEEYPVQLLYDKFAGRVLIIRGRFKTFELTKRQHRFDQRPQVPVS